MSRNDSHTILIVGGGSAGLTVAARLHRADSKLDIAVVEPSEKHYYQPLWTLVGGGVLPAEDTVRDQADYIPKGVTWIQDSVVRFEPEASKVHLKSGGSVHYDYLVVATGIELNWHGIDGLADSLGQHGVCSNYAFEQAPYTWSTLSGLGPGSRLVFTQPATPVKCGGAPQKIMYLAADHLRRRGLLGTASIRFMSPGSVVFGVPEFERTLKDVIARYGISFEFRSELIAVRGVEQEADVRVTDAETGAQHIETVPFDMLHVVPPQRAPSVVRESSLANQDGWLEVDPHTLRHTRFPEVFGLGDTTSTPNAKTGAAVRKQAPILVANLLAQMRSGSPAAGHRYNGYSSCPLVTGYGKLVLAEFDYDNRPDPSFPFDTTKERASMYLLKRHILPPLYWKGMLRGRA
ncbi:MAG: NAD(P)/FAD-dependent oxidoreductase [Rhodothermales bacterium]|nr:NAD(P)/FAD-dependent oxidoreductase [Rhodothermales bacterium]MBO6778837.1 NAD(P)/FAD-dependent oxidoreductase [Rhodothermales bacterium]